MAKEPVKLTLRNFSAAGAIRVVHDHTHNPIALQPSAVAGQGGPPRTGLFEEGYAKMLQTRSDAGDDVRVVTGKDAQGADDRTSFADMRDYAPGNAAGAAAAQRSPLGHRIEGQSTTSDTGDDTEAVQRQHDAADLLDNPDDHGEYNEWRAKAKDLLESADAWPGGNPSKAEIQTALRTVAGRPQE